MAQSGVWVLGEGACSELFLCANSLGSAVLFPSGAQEKIDALIFGTEKSQTDKF